MGNVVIGFEEFLPIQVIPFPIVQVERPATYRQRKVLHILAWHQRGDRLGVLATASTRLK